MNPNLQQWLTNRVDGKAMRRLKVERESLIASLKATGTANPATILNFNPVALSLDGGIGFKVPSCVDTFIKKDDQFRCRFNGREYVASILTIREPRVFPQITDVKKEEDVEVGEYAMKACKQIEIAHCFMTAYTFGSPSSSGMGGVVAFEGDRRTLEHAPLDKLKVKVPDFILLPNRTREYFTKEVMFSDVLSDALSMQKLYAQSETQKAQSFWDNEELRMNITDIHRIWHQFEMHMGWRQKPAPWITMEHESEETCAGCGVPKKRIEAYFCVCGRPYDPFKAYMAGELPITSDHMVRIAEGDWAKVHKEEARRKKMREGKPEKEQTN